MCPVNTRGPWSRINLPAAESDHPIRSGHVIMGDTRRRLHQCRLSTLTRPPQANSPVKNLSMFHRR